MHNSILLALWAGASFILYKIVAYVLTEIHYRKETKRLGCGPPHYFKLLDIQGVRNAWRMIAADKRAAIPDYIRSRVDNTCAEEGKYVTTFGMKVLGAPSIFTVDPKNVQAVLATQFKDFGLGERRNSNFAPLLGQGIVSVSCSYYLILSLKKH